MRRRRRREKREEGGRREEGRVVGRDFPNMLSNSGRLSPTAGLRPSILRIYLDFNIPQAASWLQDFGAFLCAF